MDEGSIVVVNLQNPKEKFVGKLIAITTAGVTLKGVEVNSFNDWMSEFTEAHPSHTIFPTTVFLPMHRVLSCYLDEDMGEVLSFGSQFKTRTRREIQEVL
jgi:hypothetical protein